VETYGLAHADKLTSHHAIHVFSQGFSYFHISMFLLKYKYFMSSHLQKYPKQKDWKCSSSGRESALQI
jgi:hypothetical protein